MAVTQTGISFHKGLNPIPRLDATDATYHVYEMGPIYLVIGSGTPNAVLTAPIGSQYIDVANGQILANTDGGTTWTKQSSL